MRVGTRQRIDPVVLAAFGCIVALLLIGSLYSSNFLSPAYLVQQLQVASFLGVITSGLMLVVLLGHIDLSIPWVVAMGGMMSTAAGGWGGIAPALAIPIGIASGLGIGLLNGVGVAYLRVPSMIFTLATNVIVQGLMVVHTSGFAPQDRATAAMHHDRRWPITGRYTQHGLGLADSRPLCGSVPDPIDLRPSRLRHRQLRVGGLPLGC